MSKLRSVSMEMWDDNWFSSLNTNEKVVFLYLITNHKTNMLGVYEITMGLISFQTKVSVDEVKTILVKFTKDGKLKIVDDYIILMNFVKHQNYNPNMKKSAIDLYNKLEKLNLGEKVNLPPYDKQEKVLYNKMIDDCFNIIIEKINHLKPLGNDSKPLGNGSEIEYNRIEVELESELKLESELELESKFELEKQIESKFELEKQIESKLEFKVEPEVTLESEIKSELEPKIDLNFNIEEILKSINSIDDCLIYFQHRNKKITTSMLHYVINTQNDNNLIEVIGEDNWNRLDSRVVAKLIGFKI
jgi:hypothetical protein